MIGDFTAKIGDPTERSNARQPMTEEEIQKNIATYKQQAARFLDINNCHFIYNSSWLAKLTLSDFVSIASRVGLSNLIEREDFAARLHKNLPVFLHELFYPIFQGYDSVEIKADIEIGGWDQRLNMLMGRFLQNQFGQSPQDIILLKPLIGLDGKRKMSSSYNNYIAVDEAPDQIFGKIMSVKDELIVNYAELAAGFNWDRLSKLSQLHPKEAKQLVAEAVVSRIYDQKTAKQTRERFEAVFTKKQRDRAPFLPIEEIAYPITLSWAVAASLSVSRSQANRLIRQNAVKINGRLAKDDKMLLDGSEEVYLEIGKYGFLNCRKRIKGFTLIEALTVVAIIGILASIGTYSFLEVRKKIRDARRKHDLATISRAFEARKLDKTCSKASEVGLYPYLDLTGDNYDSHQKWVLVGHLYYISVDINKSSWQCDKPFTFYLPNIPNDPRNKSTNRYSTGGESVGEGPGDISPGSKKLDNSNIFVWDLLLSPTRAYYKCETRTGQDQSFEVCTWAFGSSDYLFSNSDDRKRYRLTSKLEAYKPGVNIIRDGTQLIANCEASGGGYLNMTDCKEYNRQSQDWVGFGGPPYPEAEGDGYYFTYFIGN